MVLERPPSRIDPETVVHGGKDARLVEDGMQHGEAIGNGTLAEAESGHEAGREDRGVPGVAKA
jgi:hypothetical protein